LLAFYELIYVNSYIFYTYFILLIFSKTYIKYLIFTFLTLSSAGPGTHDPDRIVDVIQEKSGQIRIHINPKIHTHQKEGEKQKKGRGEKKDQGVRGRRIVKNVFIL